MSLRVRIVELTPPYQYSHGKRQAKKHKDGYCKACGSKLTDETSLRRGYGPQCYQLYTAIVLEMIPDTKPE